MMIFNWIEFDQTGKPAPKMEAVMERHYNNSLFSKYPDILIARGGITWRSFKEEAAYLSPLGKVEAVHKLWNSRKWKSDQANWHEPDYWATPLEFALKGGDCEDYAIAKLLSLYSLGMERNVRMIIGINHALLYVRLDEDEYVSDNVGKLRKSFPDGFEPLLSVSTTNVYNLLETHHVSR